MKNIYIIYRLLARKIYRKRINKWKVAAGNLAFATISLNILTLCILPELLFNIRGLGFFLKRHPGPWAPITGVVIFLVAITHLIFSSKKLTMKQISLIRRAFYFTNKISRGWTVLFLLFSLICFLTCYLLLLRIINLKY